MDKKYIMAIDQGTSGTRVILFGHSGDVCSSAYREIKQIFANPGWVEHDPYQYLDTVKVCAKEAIEKAKVHPGEIAAIGITNQRETTILWDKDTGKPVNNAICWQCRRSAAICDDLKTKSHEEKVSKKTGLVHYVNTHNQNRFIQDKFFP